VYSRQVGLNPGGGEFAQAFFREGEAIRARVEVALVQIEGIHLFGTGEARGAKLVFKLLGAEEEAEGLARCCYAVGESLAGELQEWAEFGVGEGEVEAETASCGKGGDEIKG